jgi:hypothetical protein
MVGRREQMPQRSIVICTEEWPAKVITSLMEKPWSIQRETVKWRRSCQRKVTSSSAQSGLNRRLRILACIWTPPLRFGGTEAKLMVDPLESGSGNGPT